MPDFVATLLTACLGSVIGTVSTLYVDSVRRRHTRKDLQAQELKKSCAAFAESAAQALHGKTLESIEALYTDVVRPMDLALAKLRLFAPDALHRAAEDYRNLLFACRVQEISVKSEEDSNELQRRFSVMQQKREHFEALAKEHCGIVIPREGG